MRSPSRPPASTDAEQARLDQESRREQNWKRWGTYLSERQWGTVREDYSRAGDPWTYFPHEQARSRAYRWGEDGLLGLSDRQCRLCFSVALWNGADEILKERLFGLTGPEGNHGEDVKECYYYLDATPTHSYARALYKYPQRAFPYRQLVARSARRGLDQRELELIDTGIFDGERYFDVFVEYAKAAPEDLLIRITAHNRAASPAHLHLLPTLWYRNTWAWGRQGEGCLHRPATIERLTAAGLRAVHPTLGEYALAFEASGVTGPLELLFTDNETNAALLFGAANRSPYTKDAFHRHVIDGEEGAVNPAQTGSKACGHYQAALAPSEARVFRLRLAATNGEAPAPPRLGADFDEIIEQRRREADTFYARRIPAGASAEEAEVVRQAYAGLLWTKQFYCYVVEHWLEGDPGQPAPPAARRYVRNQAWRNHLYNRDVISVPDKWEYPWYAAWDLAFHMVPFARIDPGFAKDQLELFLREWYMHPSGQLPAYEFDLSDVNPPVHAWAAWRVYQLTAEAGQRDRAFLSHVFQKLLMNFTWWVNRKDSDGNNIFSGGFLGLDNIGVFDRSKRVPSGNELEQADGTAWMAFYSGTMLSMALELARLDPGSEDLASKFFEHFVAIADSINTFDGTGLWDEEDGFYYDHLRSGGPALPLRIRSMVGIIPLFATAVIERQQIDELPGFCKRKRWFMANKPELAGRIFVGDDPASHTHVLLALVSPERLVRILRYVLDEAEFLSPFGIRSLSRVHRERPYRFELDGQVHAVGYVPAESDSGLFGGNSNWRGPIWFPLNFLLIEALETFHRFFPALRVEYPTGSGVEVDLQQVADDLAMRLGSLFLRDGAGRRPCHGDDVRYRDDPRWRDLLLFHEYFDGDTGRGVGASHQTGWTALVAQCVERAVLRRSRR